MGYQLGVLQNNNALMISRIRIQVYLFTNGGLLCVRSGLADSMFSTGHNTPYRPLIQANFRDNLFLTFQVQNY